MLEIFSGGDCVVLGIAPSLLTSQNLGPHQQISRGQASGEQA